MWAFKVPQEAVLNHAELGANDHTALTLRRRKNYDFIGFYAPVSTTIHGLQYILQCVYVTKCVNCIIRLRFVIVEYSKSQSWAHVPAGPSRDA